MPSPEIEGARNLTDGLTRHLTTSLTGYLTADLTESGVREVRVAKQRGSGGQGEAVAALVLGSLQGFGHDGMVHTDPLRDDVLPGFSLRQ